MSSFKLTPPHSIRSISRRPYSALWDRNGSKTSWPNSTQCSTNGQTPSPIIVSPRLLLLLPSSFCAASLAACIANSSRAYVVRWDPTREDPLSFLLSGTLYCTYYHLQIFVHRPFITSTRDPTSALSFSSLAVCTNAARSCIRIDDVMHRRFTLVPCPLFQVSSSPPSPKMHTVRALRKLR